MAATLQYKSMGCPLTLLLQAEVQCCSDTCVHNTTPLPLPQEVVYPQARCGAHRTFIQLATRDGSDEPKSTLVQLLNMQQARHNSRVVPSDTAAL